MFVTYMCSNLLCFVSTKCTKHLAPSDSCFLWHQEGRKDRCYWPEMLLCVIPRILIGLVLLARDTGVMCGSRNADRPGAAGQRFGCYGNESECVHTYQPALGQSLSSAGAHKPSSG